MDDNTKDTWIFALRCLTVMVCGFLSITVPYFVIGA